MKFRKTILPNGDLQITADNGGRAWIKAMLQALSVNELWPDFVEYLLQFYYPWLRIATDQDRCDLVALTSSTILLETTSTGEDLAEPRVWWFPQHKVENEFDTLKNTGRLVMTLALGGAE